MLYISLHVVCAIASLTADRLACICSLPLACLRCVGRGCGVTNDVTNDVTNYVTKKVCILSINVADLVCHIVCHLCVFWWLWQTCFGMGESMVKMFVTRATFMVTNFVTHARFRGDKICHPWDFGSSRSLSPLRCFCHLFFLQTFA